MRLDLGGGRRPPAKTTEDLLKLSTYEDIRTGRSSRRVRRRALQHHLQLTGELPPNLQGVWGGTYVPGWASDYTHNGNVPSAIAANLMGNMPELMLAYTSATSSRSSRDMQLNAKHLFGARGVVLPSRTTTHGYNNA
jgi:alpha-L-fucosidase 2